MYTVLGPNLLPIGSLNINGNSKGTKFWGDTISQQIADDGSSDDPSTSLSMTANKIDTQANHKLWNHTITINFDNDDLGGQIISGYYLVYYDDVSLRYYLMNLTNVKESPQGGYRTATGSNAAIYDMAGIKPAKKSFTQASLTQILTYIFDDVTWSLKVEPNGVLIDYDIDGTKTVQSILQELQIKFSTEVDAYITLNNSGMIDERIVEVKKMGSNKGTLIRDGSSNNGYDNIIRTSVSDTLYTKFYISGVTDENNPDHGSITSVNNGLNYIVDDDANRKYNPVGASQGSYREVSLENTVLKEPTALLDWGKEQVQLFNHPRYNYTVTSLHDMQASLGDTVAIQDLKAIPEILITSRVIQRTFSFSSPETNTLVFGEFSNLNIVSDITNEAITVLKKQVTIANQTANNAINTADDAKQVAIQAQESADGKGVVLTLNSKDDLPAIADEGTQAWVNASDGIYHYVFVNGEWKEDISPTMQKDITDKVTASLTEAKDYSNKLVADNNTQINNTINEVSQEKIDLALKNADFNEKAQAMADKALSDAKANAANVAQETLNSANQNIADAKKSLSDSIASEASARNQAVAAANSQAQTYANQAKADALNTIAKEVSDRQNAVSALDTKATNAVNQAKSDINDTINALSVGGRNYLLNSNGSTLDKWTPVNGWSIISDADRGNVFTFTPTTSWTGGSTNSLSQTRTNFPKDKTVTVSFWAKASVDGAKFHSEPTGGNAADNSVLNVSLKINWQRYSYTFYLSSARIYFMPVDSGVTYWVDDLQLEIGNMISDYSQAPEDIVYDYTDKDNQIKQTFTQYQQSNDGKVSKAQTDATQALGLVATKVSQTDYNQKTGDLSTKYTEVKQTVDSQATDIVDIKKTASSQASKINSISSDVDGTKQSISDINTEQGKQSSKINQITTDVDGTKQAITDIQTADGKQDVRMGNIETSVSGVKSDFSTYKTTNDGVVKTAQTTAQTAVDGLKNKVSQTDYNTKTGQLQTDLTTITQTANQAKTDIVSIKQKDGEQDAKMNSIVSDANGTKQTVSDLQTTQGEQSGYISTLQQRADGFEGSIRDINGVVNDLQQINQITNSEFTPDFAGWHSGSDQAIADETSDVSSGWYRASGRYQGSTAVGNVLSTGINSIHTDLIPVGAGTVITGSVVGYSTSDYNGTITLAVDFAYYDSSKKLISNNRTHSSILTDWTRITLKDTTPINTSYVSFGIVTNGNVGTNYYSQPLLVFADVLGNYVRGSYNNNGATAKAQLTADQASAAISKLTSADGIITKAQADIKANADAITQKVSKTVYDQNTGDLTQAISKAQSTADGAVSTVGNYKTSNDKRVEAAESAISQNAKDITARVTKTDYDNYKSTLNTRFTKVEATADGASTTVGELKNTVNAMGQINQLFNTEFSPDFQGWTAGSNPTNANPVTTEFTLMGTDGFGSNVVSHKGGGNWINSAPITVTAGMALSFSSRLSVPKTVTSGTPVALYIMAYNATNARVLSTGYNVPVNLLTSTPTTFKIENIVMPAGAVKAFAVYAWNVSDEVYISQPMLVFSSTVGKYVQGNYNNNVKIASQQITIDGLTDTVSNPTTGLTKRVQTAEGTLSTVKSTADGAMSKASQTANDISQEISDRKTGDNNTLQSSKNFTQSTITSYDSGLQTQLTQTNDAFLATVSANNLVVDSSLIDSAYSNSIVNWTPRGQKKWYYSAGVSYNGVQSMGYNQNSLDGDYSYLDSLSWSNFSFTGTTLNVSVDVKVNTIGSAETDYLIVYLIEADADMKTVAQTSITGTLRDSNSSWTNYRKRITVNSASKTFFLRYQMRGNGNVYIARPYVGIQELVAGGYTAGFNNNNQTILSLFKDNWSIGINDNIGGIVSGIVGNASQMSLISKKVVIDSPNTQITGTAWINSAMIGNGQIGTAQIGDAAITSAKIAYLDVSKLTGDTITGFNFNINKSMNIASGGVIKSDVVNMDKTSFTVSTTNGNSKSFVTSYNIQTNFSNVNFSIDSSSSQMASTGTILAVDGNVKSSANFETSYSPNNLYFASTNWTGDTSANGRGSFLRATERSVTLLSGANTVDKADSYTNISSNSIQTKGSIYSDAGIHSGPLYTLGGGAIYTSTGETVYFLNGKAGGRNDIAVKTVSQSSLVSQKTNIGNVDTDYALNEVLKADVRSYIFIDDEKKQVHVSPMIDDVDNKMYIPKDWLDSEHEGVDTYSVIGYLIQAVKELNKKIEQLEQA